MQQTITAYSIQAHHWWIAISIAFILHFIIVLNYQPSNNYANADNVSKELVIGLKKLKMPEPKMVAPQIPPQEIVKPQPVTKPVVRRPVKPKIVKPKLAPLEKIEQAQVATPKAKEVAPQILVEPAQTQSSSASASAADTRNIKADYLIKLAIWLDRHKRYPAIARRRGQEGEISVRFSINAAGELLSHQLISPSAHTSLNMAVIKMLQNASPMPTVPAELQNGKSTFDYTIPVHFKLNNNR